MDEGLCLVAQSLNYVARPNKTTDAAKSILKHVDLVAKPGQFTAIMGPSGSGKTSLLNIIAGRTRNVLVDYDPAALTNSPVPPEILSSAAIKRAPVPFGRILLNGTPVNYDELRSTSRYVMQSDCLLPFLSVAETIRFAAQLKLTHLKSGERRAKVDEVINKLGLEACKDVAIGDQIQKGISGGQRKRVSIALELLEDPQLLFLDEPTSGLDSSLAFDVIQTVKMLVRKSNKKTSTQKMTVICTIHQPRKQIFDMFDRLTLMSLGEIVYQGPAKEVSSYWSTVGYPLPPRQNVADWSLDLLSAALEHPDDIVKKESRNNSSIRNLLSKAGSFVAVDPLVVGEPSFIERDPEDQFSSRVEGSSIRDASVLLDGPAPVRAVVSAADVAKLPNQFANSKWGADLRALVQSASLPKAIETEKANCRRKEICGNFGRFFMNIGTLAHRFFLNRARNKLGLFIMVFVNLFIVMFMSFVFYQIKLPENDDDCTPFYNFIGFAASMGISASFSIMQNWMDFPNSRPMINRERAGGLYNSWSLLFGMIIGDLPILLIPGTISALVSYWIVGYGKGHAEYFFFFWLFAFSISFASTGWVMFAVMLAPSASAASAITPIGVVVSILLSGLWITDSALPKVWLGIRYLTWIRYGVNALLINRFGADGVVSVCGTMPTHPGAWGNIGCLYALGMAYRLLAGVVLQKVHTRQGLEA